MLGDEIVISTYTSTNKRQSFISLSFLAPLHHITLRIHPTLWLCKVMLVYLTVIDKALSVTIVQEWKSQYTLSKKVFTDLISIAI